MNTEIIFAGGTGQRMNTKIRPKQFLELHGKPIIIYTLEHFDRHELIDGIIVICVKDWIDYCQELVNRFKIEKVKSIIPGGETGLLSRYEGVKKAKELYPDDTICLILIVVLIDFKQAAQIQEKDLRIIFNIRVCISNDCIGVRFFQREKITVRLPKCDFFFRF